MRSTQQMRARLQRCLRTRLIEIDIFIEFESCMRFIMVVVMVGGGGYEEDLGYIRSRYGFVPMHAVETF